MSLLAIAMRAHPDYPIVLLFNRDELHARPTTLAAWWPENADLLGGRDPVRGGTWLAVSRDGRFSTVTAHRDNAPVDARLPPVPNCSVPAATLVPPL